MANFTDEQSIIKIFKIPKTFKRYNKNITEKNHRLSQTQIYTCMILEFYVSIVCIYRMVHIMYVVLKNHISDRLYRVYI